MWLPDLASARGHGDVLRALCCGLPRSAVRGKLPLLVSLGDWSGRPFAGDTPLQLCICESA